MSYKMYDEINVLETNLDDCTGEMLGYVLDRLFEIGAKDVFYTPIFMKKNRPAYRLTVLCSDDTVDEIEDIIFEETTSIGIRKRKEQRTILKRELKEIETPLGQLKVKVVKCKYGEKIYPEFESARELAKGNNVPLKDVYKEV